MNPNPKDEEIRSFVKNKMDEVIQSLVDDATKEVERVFKGPLNGLEPLFGKPIKRKWWQFWKPQFTYPELESDVEVKVKPGASLPIRKGQVTKVKSAPEYDPNHKIKGGHVTRTMPRQLRKLKEAQEARIE